jgi:hypothetical protein
VGEVPLQTENHLRIVQQGVSAIMSSNHDITEDIVFDDLISIQYHALQGSHLYERFLHDARDADHPEVADFIEECRQADERRANRCHELLKDLTADTETG